MTADDYAAHLRADLACRDCASQVRVTIGSDPYLPYLARVIHTGGCSWYARHQAKEPGYGGPVPCSTRVTHRGPYKRDPDCVPLTVVPPCLPPVIPVTRPGICSVPGCGDPARLYPAGWLCDPHKPGQPSRSAS